MPSSTSSRTIGASGAPELRLDHHQEVVGLSSSCSVLALLLTRKNSHDCTCAREQRIEIVRHHVLEAHEVVALADLEEARHAEPIGTLTRARIGTGRRGDRA